MSDRLPGLTELVLKSAVVHTGSYFVIGATALFVFNYAGSFASGELQSFMRPTSDPLVMAGPLFQPIRGALFGLVFFLLRDTLYTRPNGWLIGWAMLAIVGIINTFGPPPGSIEGAIYTKFSWQAMVQPSMIEVYSQSLALECGRCFSGCCIRAASCSASRCLFSQRWRFLQPLPVCSWHRRLRELPTLQQNPLSATIQNRDWNWSNTGSEVCDNCSVFVISACKQKAKPS